ncbi:MAG: hypothetical protein AAF598_14390 [Bacteroidota bacterium]
MALIQKVTCTATEMIDNRVVNSHVSSVSLFDRSGNCVEFSTYSEFGECLMIEHFEYDQQNLVRHKVHHLEEDWEEETVSRFEGHLLKEEINTITPEHYSKTTYRYDESGRILEMIQRDEDDQIQYRERFQYKFNKTIR